MLLEHDTSASFLYITTNIQEQKKHNLTIYWDLGESVSVERCGKKPDVEIK